MHPRHDAEGQRKQGTPSTRPGAYEGNAPANDRMQAHGASSYSFRGKLEEIKKQTQEKEQADQSRAFRIKLIIGVVILVLLLLCGFLL